MDYFYELISIGVGVLLVTLYFLLNSKKLIRKLSFKETEEIHEKVNHGPVILAYASQSGTASSICNQLAEEAEAHGFMPKIVGLEKYKTIDFQKRIVVFIVATHGEGEPTDNSVEFSKWLMNKDEHPNLSGLKFIVFGLGNSQYEHYNAMGKKVNKYLETLGGERIYKYGEGDDLGTREIDFADWKADLWTELSNYCNENPQTYDPSEFTELPNEDENVVIKTFIETFDKAIDPFSITETSEFELQTQNFMNSKPAKVTRIEELRPNDDMGSTLHIELEGIEYKTAQNLAIFPENDFKIVKQVAEYLGVDLETRLKINPDSKTFRKLPFPSPISVESILTQFCDFQGPIQFQFPFTLEKRLSKRFLS